MSEFKKISAVDWLVNELKQYNVGALLLKLYKKEIEQANKIFEDQIIDAHIEGQRVFDNYKHTQWTTDQAEDYYNETYDK
jgi:hypothetical protein